MSLILIENQAGLANCPSVIDLTSVKPDGYMIGRLATSDMHVDFVVVSGR